MYWLVSRCLCPPPHTHVLVPSERSWKSAAIRINPRAVKNAATLPRLTARGFLSELHPPAGYDVWLLWYRDTSPHFQFIFIRRLFQLCFVITHVSLLKELRWLSVVTRLRARRPGVRFPAAEKILLSVTVSKQALEPTKPPMQWVPGTLFLGVKLATKLPSSLRLRLNGVVFTQG